jgi:N6-L-threonylcarbamoyladenine synthase
MIILAIDTSCDETSVAVTKDLHILSNSISSQIRFHKKYGGVVPFLAKRLHQEKIDSVLEDALQRAKLSWKEIDGLAVTVGPGLAPALEVGIQKAKQLAEQECKPLFAVNHMTGHIASCYLEKNQKTTSKYLARKDKIAYPAIALLVSGGHTEMVYFDHFAQFRKIGQTLDDALGEAYDKMAKMLDLGYPGGKIIARFAQKGDLKKYNLPIPMQRSHDLNFSYSGLKNALRLKIKSLKEENTGGLPAQVIYDLSACFEDVAQKAILQKVELALKQFPECKSLLLGGGVASNLTLRKKIRHLCYQNKVNFYTPISQKLCTDNAAMIGAAAYLMSLEGIKPVNLNELDRQPGLEFD